MPGRRTLRPTPSSSEELHPFQKTLLNKLDELVEECQGKRESILAIAQQYQKERRGNMDGLLDEVGTVFAVDNQLTDREVSMKIDEVLAPLEGKTIGLRNTSVLSWSYDDTSM